MTGYLLVLLAASLWALIGPLARFCMDEGLSPTEIALWRAAFGALFFALHAWRGNLWKVDPWHGVALAAFGIVGVGVLFGSYQYAVQEGGAALAAVLLYTAPAWVALLSRVLLHEPLTRRKLAALVVAMTGAVLTCLSGGGLSGGASTAGIVAGLVSGFAYSLHYIFSAHWMRRYSPVTLYLYCLPAGVATLAPLTTFTHKTPTAWILLVAIGLLTTYCAYFVYCEGIRRLAPTRVAIVANLEPVLAALLAYLWWGELFPPLGWLGAALVLAAVFLIVLDRSDPPQAASTPDKAE